jgi:hypothetical protein
MTDGQFPSEGHARLDILTGIWDTEITMLNADGSEGGRSSATDSYRWMPNGQFLVHEVDARMGDEHVQSTEIFAVDGETGAYTSRSYDPDGSINDFVSRIAGLAYSIDGRTQRFAGEFSADGRQLLGEWRQLAEGQWLPFVRVRLSKRA